MTATWHVPAESLRPSRRIGARLSAWLFGAPVAVDVAPARGLSFVIQDDLAECVRCGKTWTLTEFHVHTFAAHKRTCRP